ncbi:uncharacterized protein LOC135564962 [Oncorhynchus nerka]|uniref:uncharacterized protein LOC135564962 n=1 Tax=Oncorhynchus nerka TaxID=8023 RepID=UPI0031B885A5
MPWVRREQTDARQNGNKVHGVFKDSYSLMHGSYSWSYSGSCCVLTEGMETLDARRTGARMQDMDIMDLHPSLTPEVEDFLPELDLDGFLEHEDFPFDFNDALFDLDFNVDIQTGEVAIPTAVAEPGDQKQNCETQRALGDGQRKRRSTEAGDGQRKRRATELGNGQRKRRATEPGDGQRKRRATEPGDGQRKKATEPVDGQRKRETQTDSPIRGCAGSPPLSAVTLSSPPPRLVQIAPSLFYIPGFGTATFISSCSNGSELQLVQAPVFGFSRPPTYILMSSPSLSPRTLDVLPLSPVDGALAPDSMCSYPPGSLSDCASQALPPPSASPLPPGQVS